MRGLGSYIQAGYKAGRTRQENKVRQKAFEKLTEIAKTEGYLLPGIAPCPEDGFQLSYSLSKDSWYTVRCETSRDCFDYIVGLLSFGCWSEPKIISFVCERAVSWHEKI